MISKTAILLLLALTIGMCALMKFDLPVQAGGKEDTAAKIMSMERAALDRWIKGDPDGFLDISDPEVVYFDPAIAARLNGLDDLRKYYEPVRGKINMDRYEMIEPRVHVSDDHTMAVLTFNFVSYGSTGESRWNTTEVYRLNKNKQWRIIQTHWSPTQPKLQK